MTMSQPSLDSLAQALADAGAVHHDYEQVALGGQRDQLWPGFYAAFVIGRLGNFVSPSALSGWLEKVPAGASDGASNEVDWPTSAGDYVLLRLSE